MSPCNCKQNQQTNKKVAQDIIFCDNERLKTYQQVMTLNFVFSGLDI